MNEQQRERFYRLQSIRLERELDEMEAEEGLLPIPDDAQPRAELICYIKPEVMTAREMRLVFQTYKDVRLHPESTLA